MKESSLSKWVTFRDAITGFIAKWCLLNKCRNSVLMTCRYPDLGSAFWLVEANFQPIRPTTQIWVVKGHQYGIFVLISQTSFCRETSCGLVKCRLFSQAVIRKGGNDYMNVFLTVCITSILPLYSGTLPYGYLSNTVTSLLWPLFFAGYTFPYKENPINVVTR